MKFERWKSFLKTNSNFTLLLAIAPTVLFWIYKTIHLTYRYGDSAAYFYVGHLITRGILPYRDFFQADPPLYVFLLALLERFSEQNILLLCALSYLIEGVTAFLLYLVARKLNYSYALVAPLIYLSSFTVIATSDYMTGAQLCVLFVVIAYYAYISQRLILSSLFWACAILTKFYIAPIAIGFALALVIDKRFRSLLIVGAVSLIIALLALSPFYYLVSDRLVDQLFLFHLRKESFGMKFMVMNYFWQREWFLLIISFLLIPFSQRKFVIPTCLYLLFLICLKDIYYAYTICIMPFLVLSIISALNTIFRASAYRSIIVNIVVFSLITFNAFGFPFYHNTIRLNGRFPNAEDVASFIKTQEDLPIYGAHEVAPLIALLSGKEIFNNYFDTTQQSFATKALDMEKINKEGVELGIYMLARVVHYPEKDIYNFGVQHFMSPDIFNTNCAAVKYFPSLAREDDNAIGVYRCKKP